MRKHVVLYRYHDDMPLEKPHHMVIEASSSDEAEERLLEQRPHADIVWVYPGDSYAKALADYWASGLHT